MAKRKNAVLWELTRSDSVHKSYLFGTMHVKDALGFTHHKLALDKLSKCNLIACEYNLTEAQGKGLDGTFLIPENKSLKDYISPKKYNRLKKMIFKSFGLNLDQLQFLLPMTLMSLLTEATLQKDNNVSLDQFVWDKGMELGLHPAGLESFDEQLKIMSKIDIEYQVKMLTSSMKNVSTFRSKLKKLVLLYKNEEIHKLYKLSKKSLGQYKQLLLFQRNLNMVNRIVELSSAYNAFYAVGAAHLSGKKGIIHLLKQEGFKLRPC